METISLSLVLDITIIVLLVATILYAARLSLYLKKFKDSRAELEGIITDLSKHIDKADQAVLVLNKTVEDKSEELQQKLNKANGMFDELDIVVQSGDSLANRLEELAIRNRRIIDGGEGDLADLQKMTKDDDDYDNRLQKVVQKVEDAKVEKSPFMIRDLDLEKGETSDGGFTLDDNEVLSEAERDLYEALQKNKKAKGGK